MTLSSPVWSIDLTALLAQADAAWARRDTLTGTLKAIELWEQARPLGSTTTRPEIDLLLSRAYSKAYRQEDDKKTRRRYAQRATDYGQQAIQTLPESADAHCEYGIALGQLAQSGNVLKSLGLVKQAREELEKAVLLNPHHPKAHMVLAELYHRAPAVLSVGDEKKALAHAETAVRVAPHYAINHLVLARIYLDQKRWPEAHRELEAVLAVKPFTAEYFEILGDQETAREILEREFERKPERYAEHR